MYPLSQGDLDDQEVLDDPVNTEKYVIMITCFMPEDSIMNMYLRQGLSQSLVNHKWHVYLVSFVSGASRRSSITFYTLLCERVKHYMRYHTQKKKLPQKNLNLWKLFDFSNQSQGFLFFECTQGVDVEITDSILSSSLHIHLFTLNINWTLWD